MSPLFRALQAALEERRIVRRFVTLRSDQVCALVRPGRLLRWPLIDVLYRLTSGYVRSLISSVHPTASARLAAHSTPRVPARACGVRADRGGVDRVDQVQSPAQRPDAYLSYRRYQRMAGSGSPAAVGGH